MRYAPFLCLVALAACSSEASRAKNDLAFLEANEGTPRELCAAAGRLADAMMKDGDSEGYRFARISRDSKCSTVSAFPQYADFPGGVPKATDEEIANQLAALNAIDKN